MAKIHNIQSRVAGRWTKEEHQKFLYGLKIYGKNWKKIEDLIQTRNSTQIRSHAQKFFMKNQKSDNDQIEEGQSLINQNSFQQKSCQQTLTQKSPLPLPLKQTSNPSYFMGYILSLLNSPQKQDKQFNFWSNLVDFPCQKSKSCQNIILRKDQQTKSWCTQEKLQINNMDQQTKIIYPSENSSFIRC